MAARVREPIQVYLSSPERERLDRVAAELGVSRSEVLRRGLEAMAQPQKAEDAALADLVRRGILRPALRPPAQLEESERKPIMTFDELMADLDDARADREIPR
jgi:Arc/MetJ-type ribon-helix-helix transcriptional regulator